MNEKEKQMGESPPPAYAAEPAFHQPYAGQPLPGHNVPAGQVNPSYTQPGAPVVYLQVYL